MRDTFRGSPHLGALCEHISFWTYAGAQDPLCSSSYFLIYPEDFFLSTMNLHYFKMILKYYN